MKKTVLIITFIILTCLTAFAENNNTYTKVTDKTDQLLDEMALIKTYKADILQTTQYVGFGEDEFNGKVLLISGKKAVWYYTTPHKQFYYITNKRVEYYDSEMEQLTTVSVDKNNQADALKQLMLDIRSVKHNFNMTLDGNVLTLAPKNQIDIEQIKITVDNAIIVKLESVDTSGNITTINFSNIKYNQVIDEKEFDTSVPEGTEIVTQ